MWSSHFRFESIFIPRYFDTVTCFRSSLLMWILMSGTLAKDWYVPTSINSLLNGLEQFCTKWHLIVSLTKTKIMVFNKKIVTEIFIYNGNEVEIVNQYKYLGTIFSSDTDKPFKKNSEHLSNQPQKAWFALNAHMNNSITFLETYIAFKMFDVHINPILQYGAEIWCNTKQVDNMERLHLGYLKHVLQVKHSSCTPAIYADCGRFPIIITQKFQMIQYLYGILNLPENHILKYAYRSQL